ncbi:MULTISPECIES: GH92 family glycosyl hydrolase [Chitinophagaceae]
MGLFKYSVVAVSVLLGSHYALAQGNSERYTQYVNPFIGTGAVDAHSLSGSNFPGSTLPFSFIQLSPDTEEGPDDPASGYDYNAKSIVGFSHTHLSGTGVSDLFDVLLMPTVGVLHLQPGSADGTEKGYRSAFSHQQETARPGYYQVQLTDYKINAELTSTEHVGVHRYTFPESSDAHIVVDLDHSLNKKRPYWSCKILDAQIRVVSPTVVEGYRILTGWADFRKVYFRIVFSKPFKTAYMTNGKRKPAELSIVNGTAVKAAFDFDTKERENIIAKVSLSPVSMENARLNMEAEMSGWDFDNVRNTADQKWEHELEKIKVEGSLTQKKIFYTALYHAFTQPNNIADINGEYMASNYTIQKSPTGKYYSTFSLWDTYRAAHPLYTLIQPEKTVDFINSMVAHAKSYGYLPIWQLWGEENYCMIGNHAIPVIADAALKGMKGLDLEEAYAAVKQSSIVDHPNSPFAIWDKYHYMPEDLQSQSVSITLEMAYDDWCVAQFAKLLGKMEDYKYFLARSNNYKNVYNSATGFFQGKKSDGKWMEPFNPLGYGGNGGNPFTEGNAWQYYWYVPQDVNALVQLTGGRQAFENKLDTFFTLADTSGETNGNASGFIGQYAHGNEPSHHVTYLYDYIGKPWKTQYYVSKVLREQYNENSSGYTGNDDCGQMSSWYIFSAMGFYPVNPANGVYAIGSPILPKAELTMPNGKIFTVITNNANTNNCYIQRVKLNGKVYEKAYLTQADLEEGGVLEFQMGNKPNKSWASKQEDAPLSWGYKN